MNAIWQFIHANEQKALTCIGSAQVGMGRESFWLLRPTNYCLLIWVEIFSLEQTLTGAPWLLSVVLALLASPAAALVAAVTELCQDLVNPLSKGIECCWADRPFSSFLQPKLWWAPSPKCSCHSCSCWAQGLWNQQPRCPYSSSVLAKIIVHIKQYWADHEILLDG